MSSCLRKSKRPQKVWRQSVGDLNRAEDRNHEGISICVILNNSPWTPCEEKVKYLDEFQCIMFYFALFFIYKSKVANTRA